MNQPFKHSFFKKLLISYFLTLVLPCTIALSLIIPLIYNTHVKSMHKDVSSNIISISSNIEQTTNSISKTASALWNNIYTSSNTNINLSKSNDTIISDFLTYNSDNIVNAFYSDKQNDSSHFVSPDILDDSIVEYLITTNKNECWLPSKLLNDSNKHNFGDFAYIRSDSGDWENFIIVTVSKNIIFDYTQNIFSDNNISILFQLSPISSYTDNIIINSSKISPKNYNLLKSSRTGYFYDNSNYNYYQYIPSLNCTLLFSVSSDKYEPNLTPYILLFVAILLGIGLLSICTFIITSNIKKRTMKIIAALKNDDYLSVRIRTDYSDDEISYLNNQFQKFQNDLSVNINERINTELLQVHTQQLALQNQVNPHFIYNTLEIFRMQAEVANIKETSQAIAAFGAMLRYNMDIEKKIVSIKDEIEHIKNYISIMNSKYDGNIEFIYSADDHALNLPIPKFTLQPIIENSIKNNSKLLFEHILQISVQISYNNSIICISISDNGNGIPENKLKEINNALFPIPTLQNAPASGIGLPNIAKRFRFFYKEEFYMNVKSIQNIITTVTLSFPEKPPV